MEVCACGSEARNAAQGAHSYKQAGVLECLETRGKRGIPKKRFIACIKKYGAVKTINFLRGIRKLSLALQIPPKELREMLKKKTVAWVFSKLQQEYEQQQVVRGA